MELQRTKSMINCEKRNGGFCLNFYQQINTTRFPQEFRHQLTADSKLLVCRMQSDSSLWVYQFLVFPHEGKEQEEGPYVASLQSRTPDRTDDRGTSDGIKHYRCMHTGKYRSTDLVHTALFHRLSDARDRHTQNTCMCNSNTLSLAFTANGHRHPM